MQTSGPPASQTLGRPASDLAKQNQVIVFTCHTWVRDLFREVVPEAAVIELDDPEAAGSS